MQLCLTCATNENASSMPINAGDRRPSQHVGVLAHGAQNAQHTAGNQQTAQHLQTAGILSLTTCACCIECSMQSNAQNAAGWRPSAQQKGCSIGVVPLVLDHAWIKVQALRIDVTVGRSIQCQLKASDPPRRRNMLAETAQLLRQGK